MFVCYTNVSGAPNSQSRASKPYLVFVGVISDQRTVHVAQEELADVIRAAQENLNVAFERLSAEELCEERGPWAGVDREAKNAVLNEVFRWVATRRQKLVVSAVDIAKFAQAQQDGRLPEGVETPYVLGLLQAALVLQRANQTYAGNEGRTALLVAEALGPEANGSEEAISRLLYDPPEWTNAFYSYNRGPRLSQIVDTAYFLRPRTPSYLHVASYAAVVLRRLAELADGGMTEQFEGERELVDRWAAMLRTRCLPKRHILPAGKDDLSSLFRAVFPASIEAVLP